MTKKLNFKNLFLIFLIVQPFLDCYILYKDFVINLFGFSPTTILRMVVIGIYFIFAFLNNTRGRKIISLYGIILLIYMIIHHLVASSIDDNLIYSTFKYSIVEELFYLIRIFLPAATVYIVYSMNYTKEEFKNVIKYVSIFVCIIIIVLNITGLALTSYGSHQISGSIFDWFNPNFSSNELASKGWFNSANQIGGLVIVLIILMEYFVLNEHKKEDFFTLIFLTISAMMIGTRITSTGVCYVTILMYLSYFIVSLIKKKKIKFNSNFLIYELFFLIFIFAIYGISPIVNCTDNNYACLLRINNGLNSASNIKINKNLKYTGDVCNFLPLTPTNPEYYEQIYPCNDNVSFWEEYAQNKTYKYANNRTLELLVTKDVYSKIANLKINLFGMGRSRFLSAKVYLEKDVYVHYYTLGIIGIIIVIIIPYFVPCLIILIKSLRKYEFDIYTISLCFSILITIAFSYMSGHIVDELIVSLYLGLVSGMILNSIYPKKEKELTNNILIVTDERMMGGVSILLEDILNNINHKNKIDLLILHDNGNRLCNLPDNVNIIYGSKFFQVIDLNIKEVLKSKKINLIIRKIILVLLIKTHLISYKIEAEREKILSYKYRKEIAFKDGFCGLFTGYGDSKKKIAWLHSDYAKKDFSKKYRKQFMTLYKSFDKIVAVSKPVAVAFNKIYGNKDKTIVINNLVDTDKVKKLGNEEKIKYQNELNFVSVGRLHVDKGFDRVILALTKLRDEGLLHNFKYRIIGAGSEYDRLKQLIISNNMDDYIELCGRIDNPYPYVLASDLFIMSSIHESFGLVIVEALALGVPILSVKLATIQELLDSKYGMIVDNDDSCLYNGIKEILKNQGKIKEWEHNLIKYQYHNNKIIKEIESLISIKK